MSYKSLPEIVLRIVKTDPPTLLDFTSNQARGVQPRGSELKQPEIQSGLSVHDNARTVVERAMKMRKIGSYIAALHVPVDGTARIDKTLGEGHYTLWGEPETLLASILSVVPVEPTGAGI